jgi:hypothetical protein
MYIIYIYVYVHSVGCQLTHTTHTLTEPIDCLAACGKVWQKRGGGGAEGAHGSRQAAHVDGVAGRGQRRRARSCGLWRTLRGLQNAIWKFQHLQDRREAVGGQILLCARHEAYLNFHDVTRVTYTIVFSDVLRYSASCLP